MPFGKKPTCGEVVKQVRDYLSRNPRDLVVVNTDSDGNNPSVGTRYTPQSSTRGSSTRDRGSRS